MTVGVLEVEIDGWVVDEKIENGVVIAVNGSMQSCSVWT